MDRIIIRKRRYHYPLIARVSSSQRPIRRSISPSLASTGSRTASWPQRSQRPSIA